MAWRRVPLPSVPPSWRVAKHSLPVLRINTMRPLTPTMSPVVSSASRWAYFSRISLRECVRSTPTGYASPRSISLARFSMRMRICSLASAGSAALFGAGVFWEVTIPKFTGSSAACFFRPAMIPLTQGFSRG